MQMQCSSIRSAACRCAAFAAWKRRACTEACLHTTRRGATELCSSFADDAVSQAWATGSPAPYHVVQRTTPTAGERALGGGASGRCRCVLHPQLRAVFRRSTCFVAGNRLTLNQAAQPGVGVACACRSRTTPAVSSNRSQFGHAGKALHLLCFTKASLQPALTRRHLRWKTSSTLSWRRLPLANRPHPRTAMMDRTPSLTPLRVANGYLSGRHMRPLCAHSTPSQTFVCVCVPARQTCTPRNRSARPRQLQGFCGLRSACALSARVAHR